MQVKTYDLYKTAKKTALKNNLVFSEKYGYEKDLLFDFSELDFIDISETEKEIIKKSALKNLAKHDRFDYYHSDVENFTFCNGISMFYKHRVYTTSGKQLYVILQLYSLNHNSNNRESVYDEWKTTETTYKSIYTEPIDDIEI